MVRSKIEEMTNFTIEESCYQPGIEFIGDLVFNLFFWTNNLDDCRTECKKSQLCFAATVTGPWPTNSTYKCYLLKNVSQEKENGDYISFKKICTPKKNQISKEYIMN